MGRDISIKWGILILQVAILLLVIFKAPPTKSGVRLEEQNVETHITSYTTIQGFSEIHFAKNTKSQDFSFTNPEDNTCYMDVSLFSFNGEEIFSASRIEPGYTLANIELNKELNEGIYKDCSFVVRCYSMDDGAELNGATMNVNLYVN